MHIVAFLPNWIGDAVMATPALRALREHFACARITGVLRPYIAGVLEATRWIDDTLHLNKKGGWGKTWPGVALALRKRRPDLAILFPNSFRTALVAWAAGSRRRVGYRRYGRGPLLTDPLEPIRDERKRLKPSPVIDAYNLLAQTAGCPDPGHRMELATTAADEQAADRVWEQGKLDRFSQVICLNPGAAFGAAKHWPADYFARLAQRLIDERDSGVLILCGPSEREQARGIAELVRRDGVHTLADQPLSLGLTKACVRRADLLITTDSGPRHFAAAFDRPVVSLFGPTHIDWTITYHPKEVCLQKSVPCGPCQLRTCPLDHRCMTGLTPEEVFAAAARLLERFPRQVTCPAPPRKAS
jgi:heptosyltransferase-2